MNEYQKLMDFAKSIGQFPEEDLVLIPKYFSPKKVEKNEILVHAGEICQHLYFINQGILRTYHYNSNGTEFTRLIRFENQFCTNLLSFTGHTPCVAHIQALEKGEVLCITHHDFQEFIKQSATAFQLYTKILEEFQNFQLERIEFLTNYSPKEKVALFLKTNPEIANRITDKVSATYLQLTPETFCREKKKLES